MKKYTAVGAIETQNKIIENMMKPYQCMLNNYVNSFADDIRIGTANLFSSSISQVTQSAFQLMETQSVRERILQTTHDFLITGISSLIPQLTSISSQLENNTMSGQIEQLINIVNLLSLNAELKELYNQVSFSDIQELIEEEYLSEEFVLNQEKINRLSDDNKKKITHKLHSLWVFVTVLQCIFGFLDSDTMNYLTKEVPIINQLYGIIHNDNSNITANGYITKDTEVYSYSSNNADICGYIKYGLPFEVIEYHSGWLKIRYKNTLDEMKEGWIIEDKAVWSFINE